MAIVWQNSFDGPHFTSITVENSADYGDPLGFVASPATYFSEGWVAHGTSSARLGSQSNPGRLEIHVDYLDDWSIRWYSYISEETFQRVQLGSWIIFTIDPELDQFELGNEGIEEHANDLVGRPLRVEISSVDREFTARLWWGNIHSTGEPDLEVQGSTVVSQLSTVSISGQPFNSDNTFVDEIAVAEGEWIGPVVEGFDTEAELGLGVSTSAEADVTSLGGRLQTGAEFSAEVFAEMTDTPEVTTGVDTSVDVTWSTSEELHVYTGVSMGVDVESTSLIPDPPEIPPQVRFSIYVPASDTRWGYIYNPMEWKLTIPRNGVGSLIFSMSEHSPEYQAIAIANHRFDVGVEIEDETGRFREGLSCRFISLKRERNYVDRESIITWTCPAYAWMLNRIRIVEGLDSDNRRVFDNVTPGGIIYPLMTEARIREAFRNLSYQSNTPSTDFAGDPWEDDDISLEFSYGDTYLNVLNTLADMGSIDWFMYIRTLQVYNKRSIAEDKTNEVYYPFESLIEHRETATREDMAATLYSRNDRGNATYAGRTNRSSPWGRWEDLVDLPGSMYSDDMAKVLLNILDTKPLNTSLGDVSEVVTFVVADKEKDPIPTYHYKVGDRISIDWINMSDEVQRRSAGTVVEMDLYGGEGSRTLTVSLTLGKKFVDPAMRVRNRVSSITSSANRIIGSSSWMNR